MPRPRPIDGQITIEVTRELASEAPVAYGERAKLEFTPETTFRLRRVQLNDGFELLSTTCANVPIIARASKDPWPIVDAGDPIVFLVQNTKRPEKTPPGVTLEPPRARAFVTGDVPTNEQPTPAPAPPDPGEGSELEGFG